MSKLLNSIFLTVILGISLNAQLNIDFQSSKLEPNNGETVEIDVFVTDFTDIVSVQCLILWDSTVMSYATITNVTSELPQFIFTEDPNGVSSIGTPNNMSNGLDGVLSVSWSQTSTEPFTLAPQTRLFTIQLDAVGMPCDSTDLNIGELPFRPIEVIDINLSDIGAVSNTLNFKIPGAGCDGGGGGNEDLGFIGGQVAGPAGDTVCMPIQVVNFEDIQTFQGSIDWDPSEIMFVGIENINPDINGLTAGSFNTDSTLTTGTLSYAWFDFSGLNPLNFPDSTSLFEVCFIPSGDEGDCSTVSFVNSPTPVEGSNSMGQALPFYTEAGELCIGDKVVTPDDPITITPQQTNFEMNTNVCVDFTVTDFDSIGSLQYNMVWDPALLSYTGVSNLNDDLSLVDFNFFQVSNDKLRLTWNDPSSSVDGISLDDGTLIYSACFDVNGDCNTSGSINFVSDNIQIEITNGAGEIIDYELVDLNYNIICTGDPCGEPTVSQPACAGDLNGSIILDCSGDLSYEWKNDAGLTIGFNNTLLGLGAGQYFVTVTDNISGTAFNYDFLLENPDPIVLSGEAFDAGCMNGGSIQLQCTGGFGTLSCIWSGPSAIPGNEKNPMDLDPGTYNVVCTDENNCSASMEFIVGTMGGSLSLSVSSTPSNCFNGGTITSALSGSTNATYNWTGGLPDQGNHTNIQAGMYQVTVTDIPTGCTTTASVVVGMNMSNPPLVTGMVVNAGCDGGSISLDVTNVNGTYTTAWDVPGVTGDNPGDLDPGMYNVTVTTDNSGCTATASFEITGEVDPLMLSAEAVGEVQCFGDTNGSGLVSFSGGCGTVCSVLFNGMPLAGGCDNLDNLGVGLYTVTVIDEDLNSLTASFTVNGPTEALTAVVTDITDVCIATNQQGEIQVNVNGGTSPYTFSWTNQSGVEVSTLEDPTGLDAGTYSCVITDDNLCTTSISNIVINESNDPDCDTSAVALVFGNVTITSDYNGVQVTCNSECDATATLPIISGTPPYDVSVANTNFTTAAAIINLSGLCEGTNIVGVVDGGGQVGSINVIVETTPALSIQEDEIDCADENDNNGSISTIISGGTGIGYLYDWSSGGTASIEENLEAGTYILTVTDSNSCSAERSFEVEPCEDMVPETCYQGLNVLTPNGDNYNDVFEINCASDNPNRLGVYDRYGREVFNAVNYGNNWGATKTDGTLLEEGPYFWVLEVDFGTSGSKLYQGSVTVLR